MQGPRQPGLDNNGNYRDLGFANTFTTADEQEPSRAASIAAALPGAVLIVVFGGIGDVYHVREKKDERRKWWSIGNKPQLFSPCPFF